MALRRTIYFRFPPVARTRIVPVVVVLVDGGHLPPSVVRGAHFFLEAAVGFFAPPPFGGDEAADAAAPLPVGLVRFGFGAFGFFVGPFVVLFALEGDFAVLAAALFTAAAAGFLDDFPGDAAAAAVFLSVVAAAPLPLPVVVAAAATTFFAGDPLDLAAAPLFFAVAGFVFDATAAAAPPGDFAGACCCLATVPPPPAPEDDSLKEPEAPFPFVWTRPPDATAAFRYFLMNGDSFSASTL